jgi:N-acetyl-beta-hexosaminidase
MTTKIGCVQHDCDKCKAQAREAEEAKESAAWWGKTAAQLQAKLSALESQEPVGDGYTMMVTTGDTPSTMKTQRIVVAGVPVFAQPVAQPAEAPDCRTCDKAWLNHRGCSQDCTNGDKYQPAPKVVLWRTE